MAVRWVFDPAPPSGKRTGGDAAEYSFRGSIDILVRETVQNSLDARRYTNEPVGVVFKIVDLDGEDLRRFLDALQWEGLADNLEAVPPERGGRGIKAARERLAAGKLRLLIIEDHGTKGLEGPEQRQNDTDPNPFCALVRDELYSDKADSSAGGSFGLGKSVLWAFSGLKTVLFASAPAEPPAGGDGLRVIGRTTLPWHTTAEDGDCTGDGWFGTGVQADTLQRYAVSVWGDEAQELADQAFCGRTIEDTGLTAVVVGFSEPGEEDRSREDLQAAIVDAALESFFPALVDQKLSILVQLHCNHSLESVKEVDPYHVAGYIQLGKLLREFREGTLQSADRVEPGESALTWVNLRVPARLAPLAHPPAVARVAVLVRVLKDGEDSGDVGDRIFRFRGPGMVIRSDRQASLSLAARPYVAAVLAGEASGNDDLALQAEQFLRAAEPPAHDEWTHNTRRIKEDYKAHGVKKQLDDFQKAVREAVAKLVSKPHDRGGQLPKALLQFLRFGGSAGGGQKRFLTVSRLDARAADGVWTFSFSCRRTADVTGPWRVTVRLKYGQDVGGSDPLRAIGAVECVEASRIQLDKEAAVLEFPPSVARASIRGTTRLELMPAIGTRARMSVRVDGETGGIPDA